MLQHFFYNNIKHMAKYIKCEKTNNCGTLMNFNFTLYITTPFFEISIEYQVSFLVGIDANTMYTVPCAKAVKCTHLSCLESCGSNLNGFNHLTLHGVWSRFVLLVMREKRVEAGHSTRARTLPKIFKNYIYFSAT
jgi:hypothetical protein